MTPIKQVICLAHTKGLTANMHSRVMTKLNLSMAKFIIQKCGYIKFTDSFSVGGCTGFMSFSELFVPLFECWVIFHEIASSADSFQNIFF